MGAPNFAKDDSTIKPPYQMADVRLLLTGITFEEGSLDGQLPPGVEPSAGLTGLIVAYTCGTSYPFGAYSGMYMSADVEGYDAADGSKARVMLATAYGPHPEPADLMGRYVGFPTSIGSARVEQTTEGIRATATTAGKDFFTTEFSISPTNTHSAGILRWVSVHDETGEIVVSDEPWIGDFAEGTLVGASFTAPAGTIFEPFRIAEYQWAAEIGNSAFAFMAKPGHE